MILKPNDLQNVIPPLKTPLISTFLLFCHKYKWFPLRCLFSSAQKFYLHEVYLAHGEGFPCFLGSPKLVQPHLTRRSNIRQSQAYLLHLPRAAMPWRQNIIAVWSNRRPVISMVCQAHWHPEHIHKVYTAYKEIPGLYHNKPDAVQRHRIYSM